MYNILPLKSLKFLYPNAFLLITFILLFVPSVKPLLYLLSINELHMYSNQLYNYHQYKSMIKRKDYNERMNVQYFSLKGK